MRPLSSFVGQPIRSLQTMLRVIAEDDPSHLRICLLYTSPSPRDCS